jgi:hypothetical protein
MGPMMLDFRLSYSTHLVLSREQISLLTEHLLARARAAPGPLWTRFLLLDGRTGRRRPIRYAAALPERRAAES